MLERYSSPISTLLVFFHSLESNLLSKFDVKYVSSKFISWQIYYLPRNVTSLQVCILWASGSFAVTLMKGRTNVVMWNKDLFCSPHSFWKLEWGQEHEAGRTSALSFFSSLPGYSLPLGFGPCQMQKCCSNTRQTTLVLFFSEKLWCWGPCLL